MFEKIQDPEEAMNIMGHRRMYAGFFSQLKDCSNSVAHLLVSRIEGTVCQASYYRGCGKWSVTDDENDIDDEDKVSSAGTGRSGVTCEATSWATGEVEVGNNRGFDDKQHGELRPKDISNVDV